jgi:hypothetical protein
MTVCLPARTLSVPFGMLGIADAEALPQNRRPLALSDRARPRPDACNTHSGQHHRQWQSDSSHRVVALDQNFKAAPLRLQNPTVSAGFLLMPQGIFPPVLPSTHVDKGDKGNTVHNM